MPKAKTVPVTKPATPPPPKEEPPTVKEPVSPVATVTPETPKKKKPFWLIGCGCLLVIIAVIIGGAIYVWKFMGKSDKTPPELQITFPTSDDWYETNSEKLSMEGLAVDTSGVKNITWTTDQNKNGTGTLSGEAWNIQDIPLSSGDNKITVTAEDNKGNKTETSLNVVCNLGVLFYDLELSQDYVYKDGPAVDITVRAGVEVTKDDISQVTLFKLDGEKKQKLVEMIDNGVVANGDDIPGDGIFSAVQSFSAKQNEPIQLRIGVKTKMKDTTNYSGVLQIKVLEEMSAEQFSAILGVNNDINQEFTEIKKSKSGKQAAEALATYVAGKQEIESSGVSEDGYGIWWKFKESGILSAMENSPEGTRGEEEEKQETPISNQEETGEVQGAADVVSSTVKFSSSAMTAVVAAEEKELEVKNTKAIYLGPYLHDFANSDDYYVGWKTIKETKCPTCETTEIKDAKVTVEDFKTLSNYGLIVVVSHGDSLFKGAFGSNQGQVVTYTYQEIGAADYLTYLPDLLLNRLAIGVNGKLIILPSFIKAYNGTFPNSLVYMGTCRSTYNFTMASAYLSKGAKGYFGFSEYVDSQYATDVFGVAIKDFLTSDKKASEAFSNATAAEGTQDNNTPPAKFQYRGWNELTMGGKKIQNAGFEEGITGWQTEGDARTISSLASLNPTEGNKMAIISTGLGSVSDSNTALIQNICSKEGKATLKFKYNFVSEEPMEYVGSSYDDSFVANVYINDKVTNLVQKSINNASWSKIDGINFAGGDETTYTTGWADFSQDLGKITKDDTIKIEFRVSDKGDSIYDSAALIDSVSLEFK